MTVSSYKTLRRMRLFFFSSKPGGGAAWLLPVKLFIRMGLPSAKLRVQIIMMLVAPPATVPASAEGWATGTRVQYLALESYPYTVTRTSRR